MFLTGTMLIENRRNGIKDHQYARENDPLVVNAHHNIIEGNNQWPRLLLAFMSLALVVYYRNHLLHNIKTVTYFQSIDTTTHGINEYIYPGQIFYDVDGEPINAHGAGFLHYNNTYYWYGEIKQGETYLPEANARWGGTRVDFVGISCYMSTDLLNWRKCNVFNVLPAVNEDPSDDLHWSKVGERPKVIYNANTGKFVMWLHIDTMDYQLAYCGVATSDSPEGPFTYLGSFRPGGQMARDLTVFVDDDSEAYLFTSSEDNSVMHVSKLTDDYLDVNDHFERIFIGDYVEAPVVFKKDGLYHFIGSGCTAWYPNPAKSAAARSIWGPWNISYNPCKGDDANTTFHSQSTFVIPVSNFNHQETLYIFAADQWNMNNLSDSRYVWLPISFDSAGDDVGIYWHDQWRPMDFII